MALHSDSIRQISFCEINFPGYSRNNYNSIEKPLVHYFVCILLIASRSFILGLRREILQLRNFYVKQVQEDGGPSIDGSILLECKLGMFMQS